jgi:hypothetical protein
MKKINLIVLGFFVGLNLNAQEPNLENVDKLDILDKQSKEFFKAITGLEKDYLEEQINSIKTKKDADSNPAQINQNLNQANKNVVQLPEVSQEDYEKNVFKHQNEMARLTTDFTRTKKLKDIKIKSMYSFNGKDYVVLELDEKKASVKSDELSSNIEGRYIEGDYILGHKIVSINTRTKNLELYKKLDDETGYYIYLSNYGISVSDLKKIEKKEKKEEIVEKKNEKKDSENKIKKAFKDVKNIDSQKLNVKESENCLYTVQVGNLNVRNNNKINATILRVLKKNDQFTIIEKKSDWVLLNTIYKKISGDVMVVENENNWLQIIDNNVSATDNNCM